MSNEKLKDSFSDIAIALASDYESVYVINASDDSYVEYRFSGEDSDMAVSSSGEDFYADTIKNCRILVYPDDQEHFLRMFKKQRMMELLENGKSFGVDYRLVIDGRPQYYQLKTIRKKGNEIVIGVMNVDKQKRRELKDREKSVIYNEIATSLGSMFEVIYYININTGEYSEYYSSQSFSELGIDSGGENFFYKISTDIEKHIFVEDQEMLKHELDRDNLIKVLSENNTHSINYRQILDNKIQYVNLIAFRQFSDDEHIVIGVRNIDTQIRHEADIVSQSDTFNEIANALAQRYEVIYHVNILNDEYREFSSSPEYTKLEIGAKGVDFFGETQRNMKRDIYPEDYPMMAAAMDKERLLSNLKETGKTIINYRLILDGRPQYVSLLAILPSDDSDHIIIAVANIDAYYTKELDFGDAIGNALNLGEHDILTGLKNKRSYARLEMRLNGEISIDPKLSFAVVAFDVDGLRNVNEKLGHKAGDEYIIDACDTICKIFPRECVYRIGGDEFIVILENDNYDKRHEFIKDFADAQQIKRRSGGASVAFGMAEYEWDMDNIVQDVSERAVKAMYVNKNTYRGIRRAMKPLLSPDELKLPVDNNSIKFYELYVKLVSAMTEISEHSEQNIPLIESVLIDICSMHRLSKAVTRIYINPQEEQEGKGETLCCYDTGVEGVQILFFRVVTSVMSIGTLAAYMSPDEEPLSEEERWRVELVMRTTLSYVTRNRLRDLVAKLAYYDDSGFKNQRSFQRFLRQHRTELGGWIAIRYNLYHFSLINNELGRFVGDIVIKRHTEGLESIVGDNGIVCRLGGDNFVAIFPYHALGNVLTYLTEATVIYDTNDGRGVNITCSVGVCRLPDEFIIKSPGDVMEKIIASYNAAKIGGKDRIVFYDDKLLKSREDAMKVQNLFPEAIRNEEFMVYYQPKVHTETGELIGAEALCRWFHEGEIISPGAFIPVLEETNDICKLDFYMLEHVCRDIKRWIDQGRKVVRVSVNLSRKHIINTNLLDNLLKIIDRHNIPHSCIEVELTETTSDVGFNDLKRVVTGLQSVGIFTSVDDFGMGYSSLNLIRELPWNVLKVDKSFLPTEEDAPNSVNSIMFKYVIAMANELGLECIVEGVETERQLELLRTNHCSIAQGFLFDRPLPIEEFEERMTKGYYLDKI